MWKCILRPHHLQLSMKISWAAGKNQMFMIEWVIARISDKNGRMTCSFSSTAEVSDGVMVPGESQNTTQRGKISL